MAMKSFIATALLLVGCAPAVGAVPTTSADVRNPRVDTLQVTNVGATPPAPAEAPAEAKPGTSGAAYLVLGAVVLLPFIVMPSSNGAVSLYYPAPSYAPASSLPSGELPSTVEIVSTTVSPVPTVTTPQIITTPPTLATPQTSTTERTVFGVPLGKAWTP